MTKEKKSSSFMDEDWTGLTHEQIYNRIVAELEEEQQQQQHE